MTAEVLTPPRRRAGGLSWLTGSRWFAPTISVSMFLFGWWVFSRFMPPVLVPDPTRVARSFVALTLSGELPAALMETIPPFLYALVLAGFVGITVGWLAGIFPGFSRFIDPFIFALWSTPTIALLPLIFVWFGISTTALVVFVFLNAVFPIIINTQAGVRQVDNSLVEVVRALGANKSEVLRIIVIPSSYPYILSGMRIAIGRAMVGIIVAQTLMAATGIGYMLQYYGQSLQLHNYFAPLVATILLAILLNQLTNWAERRLIRWKPSAF
jgi:NitT/TauT family transport system permease protein